MPTAKTPEALIRAARERSNRGIAERSYNIIAESLDKDFLVIVGDGSLIPTREAYVEAFKSEFAQVSPLVYTRTPATISISYAHPVAAEYGQWNAALADGTVTHSGTYFAIWRRTPSGWKLRSESFVTLT